MIWPLWAGERFFVPGSDRTISAAALSEWFLMWTASHRDAMFIAIDFPRTSTFDPIGVEQIWPFGYKRFTTFGVEPPKPLQQALDIKRPPHSTCDGLYNIND